MNVNASADIKAESIHLEASNGDISLHTVNGDTMIAAHNLAGRSISSSDAMHGLHFQGADDVVVAARKAARIRTSSGFTSESANLTSILGHSISFGTGHQQAMKVATRGGHMVMGHGTGLSASGSSLQSNSSMHSMRVGADRSGLSIDASATVVSKAEQTTIASTNTTLFEAAELSFATEWHQSAVLGGKSDVVRLGDVHTSGNTFKSESDTTTLSIRSAGDVHVKSSNDAGVAILGDGNFMARLAKGTAVHAKSIMLNSTWSEDIELKTTGGQLCVGTCNDKLTLDGNSALMDTLRGETVGLVAAHSVSMESRDIALNVLQNVSVRASGGIHVSTGHQGSVSLQPGGMLPKQNPVKNEDTMRGLQYATAGSMEIGADDHEVNFNSDRFLALSNGSFYLRGTDSVKAYANTGNINFNSAVSTNGLAISGTGIQSGTGVSTSGGIKGDLDVRTSYDVFMSATYNADLSAGHRLSLSSSKETNFVFSDLSLTSKDMSIFAANVSDVNFHGQISSQRLDRPLIFSAKNVVADAPSVVHHGKDIEVWGESSGLFAANGGVSLVTTGYLKPVQVNATFVKEDSTWVHASDVVSSYYRGSRVLELSAGIAVQATANLTQIYGQRAVSISGGSCLAIQSAFNEKFSILAPNGVVQLADVDFDGAGGHISSSNMHTGALLSARAVSLDGREGAGFVSMQADSVQAEATKSLKMTVENGMVIETEWNQAPELLTPGARLNNTGDVKSNLIQSTDRQQGLRLHSAKDLVTKGQTVVIDGEQLEFNAAHNMKIVAQGSVQMTAGYGQSVNIAPRGAVLDIDDFMLSGTKIYMASDSLMSSVKSKKTDVALRASPSHRVSVSAEDITLSSTSELTMLAPKLTIKAKHDIVTFAAGKFSGTHLNGNVVTDNLMFEEGNEIHSQSHREGLAIKSAGNMNIGSPETGASSSTIYGKTVHMDAATQFTARSKESVSLRTGFNGHVNVQAPWTFVAPIGADVPGTAGVGPQHSFNAWSLDSNFNSSMKVSGLSVEVQTLTADQIVSEGDIIFSTHNSSHELWLDKRVEIEGSSINFASEKQISLITGGVSPLNITNAARLSDAFILNQDVVSESDLSLHGTGRTTLSAENVAFESGTLGIIAPTRAITLRSPKVALSARYDKAVDAPYVMAESHTSVSRVEKHDSMSDLALTTPASLTLSSGSSGDVRFDMKNFEGTFTNNAIVKGKRVDMATAFNGYIAADAKGAAVQKDALSVTASLLHSGNEKIGIVAMNSAQHAARNVALTGGAVEMESKSIVLDGPSTHFDYDWNSSLVLNPSALFGGVTVAGSTLESIDTKTDLAMVSSSGLCLNANDEASIFLNSNNTRFLAGARGITLAKEIQWRPYGAVHVYGKATTLTGAPTWTAVSSSNVICRATLQPPTLVGMARKTGSPGDKELHSAGAIPFSACKAMCVANKEWGCNFISHGSQTETAAICYLHQDCTNKDTDSSNSFKAYQMVVSTVCDAEYDGTSCTASLDSTAAKGVHVESLWNSATVRVKAEETADAAATVVLAKLNTNAKTSLKLHQQGGDTYVVSQSAVPPTPPPGPLALWEEIFVGDPKTTCAADPSRPYGGVSPGITTAQECNDYCRANHPQTTHSDFWANAGPWCNCNVHTCGTLCGSRTGYNGITTFQRVAPCSSVPPTPDPTPAPSIFTIGNTSNAMLTFDSTSMTVHGQIKAGTMTVVNSHIVTFDVFSVTDELNIAAPIAVVDLASKKSSLQLSGVTSSTVELKRFVLDAAVGNQSTSIFLSHEKSALGSEKSAFTLGMDRSAPLFTVQDGSTTLSKTNLLVIGNTKFGTANALPFGKHTSTIQMDPVGKYIKFKLESLEPFKINTADKKVSVTEKLEVKQEFNVPEDVTVAAKVSILSSDDAKLSIKADQSDSLLVIDGASRKLELGHSGNQLAAVEYSTVASTASIKVHGASRDGKQGVSSLTLSSVAPHSASLDTDLNIGNTTRTAQDTNVRLQGVTADLVVESNAYKSTASQLALSSPDAAFITFNQHSSSSKLFRWSNNGRLDLTSSESVLPLLSVLPTGNATIAGALQLGTSATVAGDVTVKGGSVEISTDFKAELRLTSTAASGGLNIDSKLRSNLVLQHGGVDTYTVKNVNGKLSFMEKSEASALLDLNTNGDLSIHRTALVEPFRVDGKESATVNVQATGADAAVNISSSHGGGAGSAAKSLVKANVHSPSNATLALLGGGEQYTLSVTPTGTAGAEELTLQHTSTTQITISETGDMRVHSNLTSANLKTSSNLHIKTLHLRAGASVRVWCKDSMLDPNTFGKAGFDSEIDTCYFVSTVRLGFAAAMAKCEKRGAHLVTVNGDLEHDFVKPLLLSNQSVFMGLTDVGSTEFGWSNGEVLLGGRTAETGSFFSGVANATTRNEHCVTLSSKGAWDLVDCDVPHYFMCEHRFKI